MYLLVWFIATLLTGLSAWLFTCALCLADRKDRVIAFLLLFLTETAFGVFAAGAILHSLYVTTVLVIDVGLFSFSFALVASRGWRLRPPVHRIATHPLVTPSSDRTSRVLLHGPGSLHLDGIGIAYGLILAILLALAAYVGHLLPPFAYDELAYHLVAVATWVHHHRIVDTDATLWANVYPKNAELVYTWLYLSVRGDAWVHLGQWWFGIAGIAATMACARVLGLSQSAAVMTGTLFLMAPTVLLQTITDYTDLAFTSMFLVFFYFYLKCVQGRPDPRYEFLAGIAAGMTLGIKSSAIAYIGICAISAAIRWGRPLSLGRVAWRTLGLHLSYFVVPMLSLGTYWYIHTWVVYGNPLYPFTVTVFGHVVFSGIGTVDKLIMVPNTPGPLRDLPWWRQVWVSWTTIPTYYAYDMQLGGYGLQWLIAEWPALMAFCVHGLWRRRGLLLRTVLPLLTIFMLEPANWWARYTLFMIALGAWAFAYMVSMNRRAWLRKVLSGMLLAVICGSYALGAGLFFLFHKRDSNLMVQAIFRTLHTPPQDRTVGQVVFPEYAWVDQLTAPTTIGCTDQIPFVYALFGRGARNDVLRVHGDSANTLIRQVKAYHVQFLMTEKDEMYDRWAAVHPEAFQLYRSEGKYDVYQVQP